MTLLIDTPHVPGTHALVIGVGEYPWLDGGTQPRFVDYEGMGQLSSPPESARAFARWLLSPDGYNNPNCRLASLDLLISDAATDQFVLPDGTSKTIQRARFVEIQSACRAWCQRGKDADDLLIFFYCGHGVARGLNMTLLPEDYGSLQLPPQSSLGLAIDFHGFYSGMDSCAAKNQIYFVDACRVASGLLMRTYNYSGDPVIPGMGRISSPPRNAPIYYGAVPGTTAFGRPGAPSFFTEALLKAFRGAGADDISGAWALQTDTLGRGIHHHLRRAVANTAAAGQLSQASYIGPPLAFHLLTGLPECPVDVLCDPECDTSVAMLGCKGNGKSDKRDPDAAPWLLDLPVGDYVFDARVPPPSPRSGTSSLHVGPPYRQVKIRVT
ncbi:caspase family protein [Burkholderia ubonensis]|uniref:caspase family protein n=1 Tax=Burkholderia ubonensis TaxID=101571 RepID=UPI0009B4A941|nr:caspase family protein [Burkholderia ubonensis]